MGDEYICNLLLKQSKRHWEPPMRDHLVVHKESENTFIVKCTIPGNETSYDCFSDVVVTDDDVTFRWRQRRVF